MSEDLISRSAFIKEINEHMKNVYEFDIESVSDFQIGNESKESYIVQGLFEAFELIGNVPIAYDVDKVVEQIELLSENAENNDLNTYDEKAAYNTAYRKSIEIVKAGGIE